LDYINGADFKKIDDDGSKSVTLREKHMIKIKYADVLMKLNKSEKALELLKAVELDNLSENLVNIPPFQRKRCLMAI
jgi:hypothetical protein